MFSSGCLFLTNGPRLTFTAILSVLCWFRTRQGRFHSLGGQCPRVGQNLLLVIFGCVNIEGALGALKLQIHLIMWICLIPSTSEGLKALYLRVALFSDIFGWFLSVPVYIDISESISWGTFHRVSKIFGTRQSSGKSSSLCLLHLVLWLLVSLHGVHASASEFVVTGLFMDSCVWGTA